MTTVLVHPGSLYGSAVYNLGQSRATMVREAIFREDIPDEILEDEDLIKLREKRERDLEVVTVFIPFRTTDEPDIFCVVLQSTDDWEWQPETPPSSPVTLFTYNLLIQRVIMAIANRLAKTLSDEEKERLGFALRQKRGDTSQKRVCFVLDIQQGYLSNIENGRRTPSMGTLRALCEMYDSSLSDLMEEADL